MRMFRNALVTVVLVIVTVNVKGDGMVLSVTGGVDNICITVSNGSPGAIGMDGEMVLGFFVYPSDRSRPLRSESVGRMKFLNGSSPTNRLVWVPPGGTLSRQINLTEPITTIWSIYPSRTFGDGSISLVEYNECWEDAGHAKEVMVLYTNPVSNWLWQGDFQMIKRTLNDTSNVTSLWTSTLGPVMYVLPHHGKKNDGTDRVE